MSHANIQKKQTIVCCPRADKVQTMIRFDEAKDKYNVNQEFLRDQLRDTHMMLFEYLVKALNHQLKVLNEDLGGHHVIDTDQEQSIFTNRVRLSKFIGCAPNTISNRLARLEEAGIVRKISHGPVKDMEIFINPELITWRDLRHVFAKKQNSSTAKDLEGENKSLLPFLCNSTGTNNNILIDVDKVSPNVENYGLPPAKPQREHYKNTGQCNKNTGQASSNYAKKLSRQEKMLRRAAAAFAKWFIALAFDKLMLWENRRDGSQIYPAERQMAEEYIIENYFSNCTSHGQMQMQFNVFKWRLEAIARYRKRKDFDLQFPRKFFDLENTSRGGFVYTKQWWKKSKQYKQRKKEQQAVFKDETKLQRAVLIAADNPSAQYKKQESYVKNAIPHLLQDFYSRVSDCLTAKELY
jgi:hypothetical protein